MRTATSTASALFLFFLVNGGGHAAPAHSTNHPSAQELRRFQVAPGFKLDLVASEPLLTNPVCFSIDGHGRFYVVETHRYRNAIFDITANTPWLLDDLSFRTVDDRVAFLSRTFATNFTVLTNDSEVIRLVEDRDRDGRAETSSMFAEGFNRPEAGTAAGVLAQGTNVWFACIPDLWRFGAAAGTGSVGSHQPGTRSAPARTVDGRSLNTASPIADLLVTGLGVHISVSGHDVHGLIRGHDGRIYFSFGDRGVCVTNREGQLLNVPDTGGVLRCEPDGRNMEIFCIGLRNPQELAFDDYGNLWTVDNDTAGADPCRVLHLVEGGDYGWRASYQHMKGFGPWVQEELWRGGLDGILPPAGTVSQGPAGLVFYPGTSGTPQLAGKFVHADFPGGVWAYDVKPRGASFEVAGKEKLLWNCWPTDVDFGPDGALYVLDWVQGWSPPGKGRIYRLTGTVEPGTPNAARVPEVKRLLAEGMKSRGEKELVELLGHADRRVRLEAQWELAGREQAVPLLRVATGSGSQFSRLHALWGLEMIWRQNPPPRGRQVRTVAFQHMEELLPLLGDREPAVRTHAANVLGELQFLNADERTKTMLADPSIPVRGAGVRAQGRLLAGFGGSTDVREKISRLEDWRTSFNQLVGRQSRGSFIVHPIEQIRLLSAASSGEDPFLVHELLQFYKVDVGRYLGWNVPAGVIYTNHYLNLGTNRPARVAGVLAYRRLGYHGVTNFLADTDARLVLESARAINDAPMPAVYPFLAALLDDSRFQDPNWGWSALSNTTPAGPFSAKVRAPREQVLLRALNANYRLGHQDNAKALVRFTLRTSGSNPPRTGLESDASNPASLRVEALFLLGAWEVLPAKIGDLPIKPTRDPDHGSTPTVNPEAWPGWFDRVVGLYRPLPPRSDEPARHALASSIAELIADASPEVAVAAVDAAVKLRLTNAAPALLGQLRDPAAPASVRRTVLDALARLKTGEMGEAVKLALADSNLVVRATALPHLNQLRGDEAALILGRIVMAELSRKSSDGQAGTQVSAVNGGTQLAQSALVVLGSMRNAAARQILHAGLTNLIGGSLSPALELELIEASVKHDDQDTRALIGRYRNGLPRDDGLAEWRSARHGGDAERGRVLFFEKVEVQCSRCHAIKGQGGTVGPALDKISRQHGRDYLLEAIVLPNQAIAPGYENVTVDLKSGGSYAGLVKGEDDRELRLESPEDGSVRIAKGDIVSRRRGLSAMPEGLDQYLSKRDVRDLVEYLATLK